MTSGDGGAVCTGGGAVFALFSLLPLQAEAEAIAERTIATRKNFARRLAGEIMRGDSPGRNPARATGWKVRKELLREALLRLRNVRLARLEKRRYRCD